VKVVAIHALGMRCGRAESASERIFKELFRKRSSLRISVYIIYTLLATHSILLRLIHSQSPYIYYPYLYFKTSCITQTHNSAFYNIESL
jgi:hypothetical protein